MIDYNLLSTLATIIGSLIPSEDYDDDVDDVIETKVYEDISDLYNQLGLGWRKTYPESVVKYVTDDLGLINTNKYSDYVNRIYNGNRVKAGQDIRKKIRQELLKHNIEFPIYDTSEIDRDLQRIKFIGDQGYFGWGIGKPKNPNWVKNTTEKILKPYSYELLNKESQENIEDILDRVMN